VVKEIESSIVQHYRDFCFENRIELSKFRRVYFRKKDAEDRDPRLCQALSQITADPSVDSKALLIINKLNAQGDLIDLLLIPKGSPYYDFCEDVQDFPPIREGDMFVMTVSRRDKSRPGFKYIAVVQDEVPPDIKLKRVAKVSVLPNIQNAGTEANLSFNIGIEKRLIQFSPEKIQDKIENLNESIEKWEKISGDLGNVVRGFNAACLAVGTTLTIKNLVGDLDGKAIARKEVMRSEGGWMNMCRDKVNNKDYSTIDECLLENNDKIEKDVELLA